MTSKLQDFRRTVERKKGELDRVQGQMLENGKTIKRLEKDQKIHERSLVLFREVAQKTQAQVQHHLSDLVTLAMTAVFDDPYELKVEFVQRRGKTECDLLFVKDGEAMDPLTSSGYGAVDVASFALRIASWFISGCQARNILILDEPFKHLKGVEENRRVLSMMKKISGMMGLQILMVSDERVPREDIVEGADRVFLVGQKDGVSQVEVIA